MKLHWRNDSQPPPHWQFSGWSKPSIHMGGLWHCFSNKWWISQCPSLVVAGWDPGWNTGQVHPREGDERYQGGEATKLLDHGTWVTSSNQTWLVSKCLIDGFPVLKLFWSMFFYFWVPCLATGGYIYFSIMGIWKGFGRDRAKSVFAFAKQTRNGLQMVGNGGYHPTKLDSTSNNSGTMVIWKPMYTAFLFFWTWTFADI